MNDSLALKKARIISPKALIQNIYHEKNDLTHPNYSLFLDIDGTLADFTSDPSQNDFKSKKFQYYSETCQQFRNYHYCYG